jgi:dCMP deaminase
VTGPTHMHLDKWQQAYMDTAERFASLSTAKRLQVGAIITKDNRIISIGYNGMPSGWTNECEDVKSLPLWAKTIDDVPEKDRSIYVEYETKPEVIHAEANAIAKLARSTESGLDADMYITHAPCIHCAKQIYSAGIKKVVYKNNYRSNDGINFLAKCGVEVSQA